MLVTNFSSQFAFRFTATIAVLCLMLGLEASAQPGASGGKVTSGAAAATGPTTKPTARTPAKAVRTSAATKSTVNKASPGRTAGAPANIEGKWWTTGNGFGDAEVVFAQTGSSVSGVIRYADGRTGNVTGTMVGKRLQHSWTNSAGDGGTGWLELSWNNFLGGPWRNQRTNDGSWTLSRIEGNWCFGGSRNRIRRVSHDARGLIAMTTEDGSQEKGHLEGPWLFLHSDLGSIKGEMNFRANRVEWSTGFYWTWCGR
ncbi:MAG TPA: hypothetical protein VEW46_23960 [Pyrinomonadaceae bacterium]|nr:hypothetical protein [Pyrinomonadaceae bacterium]